MATALANAFKNQYVDSIEHADNSFFKKRVLLKYS